MIALMGFGILALPVLLALVWLPLWIAELSADERCEMGIYTQSDLHDNTRRSLMHVQQHPNLLRSHTRRRGHALS